MKQPLVSVQIPTYNQKEYLIEAIESVREQTYKNLEIVISDDCSPDYDVYELLERYKNDPRVKIYRNEKNLGRVANYRHALFDLVKGEWYMNLDGDDFFINKDFIEHAINAINLAGKYDIVMFKGNTVMTKVKESKMVHQEIAPGVLLIKNTDFLSKIQFDFGFSHGSQLYNVKKAHEVDFYNRNLLDADYFSYLKILSSGHIIASAEKVYEWRRHDDQATGTVTPNHVFARFEAVNELAKYYKDLGIAGKNALDHSRKMVFIWLLIVSASQKKLIQEMPRILSKLRFNKEYLFPFLSTLKNYYFNKSKINTDYN